MGKFTITQDMVNKLKRIKSNNRLFVLRILFDKTKIKTVGDANNITNALIGKRNNSNLTEFLNGDISASTNVNADPFNKRSIINLGQGVKLDIGKFNKPVPRPGPDEFFFAGDQQIIKIPISGTVIQTSNPGNKNMGKFIITQDMVNKIKRIKNSGEVISRIIIRPSFNKPFNDILKIGKALIGPKNIISSDIAGNGTIFLFTNIFTDDIEAKSIRLVKDIFLIAGKSMDFERVEQNIIVPTAGTVINLSNPGNKNQVRTNLIFANPTFNKRSAEVFARGMGFPVGKITQLPNAIDIQTSQKFNPRNFKFTKNRRINNKIVEKILTNRLI